MMPVLMPLFVALTVGFAVYGIGLLVLERSATANLSRWAADPLSARGGSSFGSSSILEPMIGKNRWLVRLNEALTCAGLHLKPTDFLGLMALGAILLGSGALIVTHKILPAIPAGLLGATAPFAVISLKTSARKAQFEAQLPDMLTLAASSLRSGYSFLQALQMVEKEMAAPVGEEARVVVEEVKAGLSLEEALERMVTRIRSYDVDMLVTAITIQRQMGGNLAELLDSVGETIRERFRTRGEIASLTAEGRLSGIILFVMPLALLAYMGITNPKYAGMLFTHPMGQMMLGGAVVMQCLGGFVMYRMIAKIEA